MSVRFDSARSAEPPTSEGTSAAAFWIIACESLRVASEASAPSSSLAARSAGTVRFTWASRSAGLLRRAWPATPPARCFQAACSACLPRITSPQKARTSSGTRKRGSCGQPRNSFVAFSSSSPSGAPCTLDLPALFGEP